jgi:tetratricopeptide (TPR) repeat protein
VVLGLLLAGVLAYANSFQGAFVFDDRPAILDNLRIYRLWPPEPLFAGSTRPLVELTLALNYALGRLDPWGYHLVNFIIHFGAALILYGLCRRTLLTEPLRERFGASARPLAFTIALLWMLHPLQTESVTYLTQRAEALMGCFALLTLYAACRAATEPDPAAGRWTAAAVAACALGMVSKPVMVTVPLLVLAYDRTFLAGSVRAALRRRRALYLGLAATWGLLGMVVATMEPESDPTVGFRVAYFTPLEYLATQPRVVWHYLRLSCWPHPLILDYDWPLAKTLPAILPPALGLLGLLGLALRAFARRAPSGFLGFWVAGTLAPSSSFIPITDLVFEHRMYLPLAGLAGLAVGWAWSVVQRSLRTASARRFLSTVLALALASAYTALTIRRNRDYRSELAMWAETVARQPGNTRARLSFGYALAQQRRNEEALAQFNEILRLKPNDSDALNNLGLTMAQMGRYDDAIQYFQEAIRAAPDDAQLYNNLGTALLRLKRVDEAMANYAEAIRLQPRYVMARHNLATQLLAKGRYQEAVDQSQAAIDLNPFFADMYHGLGSALIRLGRLDEAVASCRKALRLDPDNAKVISNLGAALYQQGKLHEAVEQLTRALRIDPGLKDASTNLEVILREHPELMYPLLIWAAFRFGQREISLAIVLLSGFAIWGTLHGLGPFIAQTPNLSLLLLQAFMAVGSVTSLALASVVSERRRAEEALQRARDELERRVQERTAELAKTNAALKVVLEERKEAQTVLQHAHDVLEQRVEERTAELAKTNETLRVEIADRLRADAELRNQTRVLESILESIADGVMVVDHEGKFLVFNAAAEQILGTGVTQARWRSGRGSTAATCWMAASVRSSGCRSCGPCAARRWMTRSSSSGIPGSLKKKFASASMRGRCA